METQYISLNMTPTGVNPCFHISQYDVGRMLGFIVHSGGATVDLDIYTCTIEATRSDGTAITSAVATTDNIGTFEVTPTMSNKTDKYRCQLVIADANSKRIASLPFDMDVCKAAMDENSESIEEDASLYQQYTEAVRGAIAEANADIQAEENARIAAVNAEATARQNADATLQNNIDAEATARQSADNTLQGNINSEASTRASADSNLQSQINQIIAPSGEAPSAAEVENARIGADGAVYETLGDAIRTQNSNLKSALSMTPLSITGVTVEDHTFYNGGTGEKQGWSSAPYASAGLYNVEELKGLLLSVNAEYYGTAGIAFFDDDNNFIYGVMGTDVPSPSEIPQDYVVIVPQKAKYLGITINRNRQDLSTYPIMCVGSLQQLNKNLQLELTHNGEIDLSSYEMIDHSIILSETGEVQTFEGFQYNVSPFIPVSAISGNAMSFYCVVVGTAGAAFYDVSKTFISGFGVDDVVTPSGSSAQKCDTTVPKNAAYFRFTGLIEFSQDVEDYPITFENSLKLTDVVANIQNQIDIVYEDESGKTGAVYPYSALSVFEKFGVIGDSYASGEIVVGGVGTDYYNLSWGQNIARMCGTTCYNYSVGGLTTKTWLENTERGLAKLLSDDPQQLYFICLGLNDQTEINDGRMLVGSETDLDSTADPTTFYGYYGKIVKNIIAHAPNAKIIICSVTEGQPTDFATVNAAIPVIASHFNLPYINLRDDPFFTSQFYRDSLTVYHPVAVSYGGYALGIMRLFSKCAVDYLTYFKDYVG